MGGELNDIQRQTYKDFDEFAQLFRTVLAANVRGLRLLHQLRLDDYGYLAVLALMFEAHRSTMAALDNWAAGYYAQSLAVARAAHESWLVCKWIETHPEDAIKLLDVNRNERFNFFSKMATDLEETVPHLEGFKAYSWYDEVSDLVHPRASMIRETLLFLEDETADVYEGPRYRYDKAVQVAYYLAILAVTNPTAYINLLPPDEVSNQLADEFSILTAKMELLVQENFQSPH